ncbi:MAG: division/cell wall cluster transcriptional repressor MraZ [Acidimicrobiales bacterium]
MARRLIGRFEHSLDAKGRVILPAKFRAVFSQEGYLTTHVEGCLALWTPEEFDLQVEVKLAQAATGREGRNLARMFGQGAEVVEVDKQGRMAIPAHLRKFAGLSGDVLILGALDRVELWDPPSFDRRVGRETEQRMIHSEEGDTGTSSTATGSAGTGSTGTGSPGGTDSGPDPGRYSP